MKIQGSFVSPIFFARSYLAFGLVLGVATSICAPNIYAQKVDVKAQSSQATRFVIALFDTLVSKNILGADNLKHLFEHPSLINPIEESEAYNSHESQVYREQLNKIISSDKNGLIDLAQIHVWARARIDGLEQQHTLQEQVHEKTEKLYRSMEFGAIPAGHYTSSVDGSAIELPEGIELQETPITQYQWAQEMGENPSKYADGPDSEKVVIGDKKITMRANAPVESIDLGQIKEFIDTLNKRYAVYSYALPSVDEYDVLLQASLGKNWIDSISQIDSCVEKKEPCTVASGVYSEWGKKRFWDTIGNVWQWTRDIIEMNGLFEETYLVIGGSFQTKKEPVREIGGILRPISCAGNANVGLRLVRVKKAHESILKVKYYKKADLLWYERHVDPQWKWENTSQSLVFVDDELCQMIRHKERYSSEIQHTLAAMIEKSDCNGSGVASCLKRKTYLWLDGARIKDLSPLVHLSNLETLGLGLNHIENIAPLALMTGLKELGLGSNQIKDVSALAHLTNLRTLLLDNNQIRDLSSLAQLTNLWWLHLNNNQIKDVSFLAQLTNLDGLRLWNNQIEDASPLLNLKNTTITFFPE